MIQKSLFVFPLCQVPLDYTLGRYISQPLTAGNYTITLQYIQRSYIATTATIVKVYNVT